MLAVILVLCIVRELTSSSASPLASRADSTAIEECVCQATRSIWDIVWNCLVTIFACSWVSVHPNIPGPQDTWLQKFLHRLELMFWSIICPELLTYWAAKQWFAARKIALQYTENGWTKTHGHFLQMGGFVLYDGDEAISVLGPQQLENLYEEGRIKIPTISTKNIADRSKGDALAKALVVVQTGWFAVQCIARRAENLVITQLELATVAFAILNGVMYFMWWDKPLDVQSTVPIHLMSSEKSEDPKLSSAEDDAVIKTVACAERDDVETEDPNGAKSQVEVAPGPSLSAAVPVQAVAEFPMPAPRSWGWWAIVLAFLFLKYIGVIIFAQRMAKIIDAGRVQLDARKMRVPHFYADETIPTLILKGPLSVLALSIGVVFGVVHCVGWNFIFPSFQEKIIWRVCSILITGVPAFGIVATLIDILHDKHKDNAVLKPILTVSGILVAFLLPFYVLARFAIVIEAFITLRNLPPGAYAEINWLRFIPHV